MNQTALELRDKLSDVISGHDYPDVVHVLASLLGQEIAIHSNTKESAAELVRQLSDAIARDIARNWEMVVAGRGKQ